MRTSFGTAAVFVALAMAAFSTRLMAEDPASNPNAPQNHYSQTNPAQPTTQPGIYNHPGDNVAQPGMNHQVNNESGDRTLLIKSLPSKKIVGADVMNTKGEKLGSIDDVVIDLESGKVTYAALGVGGLLGIGDKLFAVPFEEFKTGHDTSNNIYFILDESKDRLENAPGFDKNHWPDLASPQWRNQIDTYYHHTAANRTSNEVNPPANR